VDIDGMHNVRDLGGVPVRGGQTSFGVVMRGETPVNLGAAGPQRFRALGIRHVLDLREPEERALDGDGPLARDYQHSNPFQECVPLAGSAISDDPIGRVHGAEAIADRYADYLSKGAFRLAEALARSAWSTSAMYVHCAVGKDRTGVVSALLLKLAGAHDDAVIDDYLLTAERLRPVLQRLGARPAYAHLACPDWAAQQPSADAMMLFLARLRAQGGARAWLLHHDTDSETVDRLESRLRGELPSARTAG
jgi:protein-tyrosine phosphatase